MLSAFKNRRLLEGGTREKRENRKGVDTGLFFNVN